MKPITVYCSACLLPKFEQFSKVKQRTETCQQVPVFKHMTYANGMSYWLHDDGRMQCTVTVLFPRGTVHW